ncbi:MAG: PKD domain-containing protein [Chloroflexia bacterium]|nr:PKD domain-containing protein [Chloroflexia bacterium]
MRNRPRIVWWLAVSLPLLFILIQFVPLSTYSFGGEVDLKQYISPADGLVMVGETVTFGVGDIPVPGVTVRWNFGDDSPEKAGWPVTHVYEQAGEYEVNATITYASGETVPTIPTRIRVRATGNTAPEAVAEVNPRTTLAGLPVTLDASGSFDPDGEITRYQWDLADGTTATEVQLEHSYAEAGLYHVILTVTDNGEMDASDIITVTVTSLPTIILPGIDRAIPPPIGPAPVQPPLILVDMGVWDVERFPYYEYEFPLEPPFRGVASSNRSWLVPDPAEFERESGPPVTMIERLSVRNTSLLPRAHTSWAHVDLVINGRIIEIPVAVTVRGPQEDISDPVWSLFNEILDYVTSKGKRNTMVYTLRYGHTSDMVLGLVTEYVIEQGYGGEIPRQDFVTKVAEMLLEQDENGDGWIGFTDLDRGLGVKVDR